MGLTAGRLFQWLCCDITPRSRGPNLFCRGLVVCLILCSFSFGSTPVSITPKCVSGFISAKGLSESPTREILQTLLDHGPGYWVSVSPSPEGDVHFVRGLSGGISNPDQGVGEFLSLLSGGTNDVSRDIVSFSNFELSSVRRPNENSIVVTPHLPLRRENRDWEAPIDWYEGEIASIRLVSRPKGALLTYEQYTGHIVDQVSRGFSNPFVIRGVVEGCFVSKRPNAASVQCIEPGRLSKHQVRDVGAFFPVGGGYKNYEWTVSYLAFVDAMSELGLSPRPHSSGQEIVSHLRGIIARNTAKGGAWIPRANLELGMFFSRWELQIPE